MSKRVLDKDINYWTRITSTDNSVSIPIIAVSSSRKVSYVRPCNRYTRLIVHNKVAH